MGDNETPDIAVWRSDVVNRALEFARHVWTPTAANVYHGPDADRIMAHTPDTSYPLPEFNCGWWVPNQHNTGLPYMWGGFSTIEQFDAGIASGRFVGDVPGTRDHHTSRECVGLDCSGLVSRCWGVDRKLSTRLIPHIASTLASFALTMPGDIFLKPGKHAMVFVCFMDESKTAARIVDASRRTGRVPKRAVTIPDIVQEGYMPYRKRV